MSDELPTEPEALTETPEAEPISSRFLFVDVAAQRAKQLRRGALPRLVTTSHDGRDSVHKLERIAMEEVEEGLVSYSLPDWKALNER